MGALNLSRRTSRASKIQHFRQNLELGKAFLFEAKILIATPKEGSAFNIIKMMRRLRFAGRSLNRE